MSTVITYNAALGMPSILIYAPDSRTVINQTDLAGYLIQVDGEAKSPFILGVRFIACTIIAENLKAFDSCYFDQTCTMKIKDMPLCGVESIHNNCVIQNVE